MCSTSRARPSKRSSNSFSWPLATWSRFDTTIIWSLHFCFFEPTLTFQFYNYRGMIGRTFVGAEKMIDRTAPTLRRQFRRKQYVVDAQPHTSLETVCAIVPPAKRVFRLFE